MRKLSIITAMLFTGGTLAFAQDMQDARRYSFNDYMGTARSMSMGNAFTALGGDLGSIGINPAGSAVNSYSQFTITPNVSIAGTETTYTPAPGLTGDNQVMITNTSRTRVTLPNIGFVVNWNPNDGSSIKTVSVGIVGNMTANYSNKIDGRGINAETSLLGEKADFFTQNNYNYWSFFDATYGGINRNAFNNFGWEDVLAAHTGMITTYGGSDTNWIGATETIFNDGTVGTAGLLDQRWRRVTSGYKYDLLGNVGINISNELYLGLNVGMIAIDYTSNTYMQEVAVNTNDFFIPFDDGDTYFDSFRMSNWYNAKGAGVYGKFGFIYVPTPEFRIGAAFQTPGLINIKETWQSYADIYYTDNKHSASEDSPEGEFEYNLITPLRFNIGAALNFGSGVVSADYEFTNYGSMRFRDVDGHSGEFRTTNDAIKDYMGKAHIFRLGAEFMLTPSFAVRAGYGFSTSPEYEYDNGSKKAVDAKTNTYSAGFGYSSSGSFFMDFAVRNTVLPEEYYYPYNSYIPGINSPEVAFKRNLWDVVLTLGWRF
ncbi:MAG: hypothetical protein IJ151_07635 [Bacteroidales bacterium]|nr:hypothetical protein [Bacteroidales bacterium]